MELLSAVLYFFVAVFATHVGIRAVEAACDISKIKIVGGGK